MLNSDNSFTIKCNIDKNSFIYNFLLMRPFSQNDVVFSNADDFVFLLGYLSSLQDSVLSDVDFSGWLSYVKHVLKLLAETCHYPLTDTEKELYPYAVALRTYPNAEDNISETRIFSTEKIDSLLNLDLEKDEQKWAFYIVGNAILNALEHEKNFRAHTFIQLMEKIKPLVNEFPTLEEKFNSSRIGKESHE